MQMLTLYYLDVLVESLLSMALHPLTLPVLYLELAIATTTLSNSAALCKLLHMRYNTTPISISTMHQVHIYFTGSVMSVWKWASCQGQLFTVRQLELLC